MATKKATKKTKKKTATKSSSKKAKSSKKTTKKTASKKTTTKKASTKAAKSSETPSTLKKTEKKAKKKKAKKLTKKQQAAVKEMNELLEKWTKLKEIDHEVPTKKYKMSEDFPPNTPIEHPSLGWGFVLSAQNNRLEVLFESGIKMLIANYKG